MSASLSTKSADVLTQKQTDGYEQNVGWSTIPDDTIDQACKTAQSLPPKAVYLSIRNIRILWELLETQDKSATFRPLVDLWTQSQGNLEKAQRCVNRTIRPSKYVWSGYGIFRMKAREGPDWNVLSDHSHKNPSEPDPDNPLPQTVVLIALTRLDHTNGFFIPLQPGQDVCIDSRAGIKYPPTGGGIGLVIWLKL